MNKLRMARRVLMVLGPVVLVLLAAAVFTTSPLVAILVVLLAAVFAGMLLLLERSLKAEYQQRWMLRRSLEARLAELERVVRLDGLDRDRPTPPAGDLDAYSHVAQSLSRIARLERVLGIELPGHASQPAPKEAIR